MFLRFMHDFRSAADHVCSDNDVNSGLIRMHAPKTHFH